MTRLRTLGGLALDPPAFTQPKPLLLLSYLAVEGPQRRRRLAELFWRDGNRMKSLSMSLTRLRQALGDRIAADDTHVWTTVPSDAQEVLAAVESHDWQSAVDLYAGTFLDGAFIEAWNRELEEWVYSTRESLAERLRFAWLMLAESAARRQDFYGAAAMAEHAYTVPGVEGTDVAILERLHTLLRAGGSAMDATLRSEAEEYGVDLQLTAGEARAKFRRDRESTAVLPVRLTSFVGRTHELAELKAVLQRPDASLVTLVGPAGVGKTRLALQLCGHVASRFEAVTFVSLEQVGDPARLPAHLVAHLGLSRRGAQSPFEHLAGFLGSRRVLLVLDNFDELIEGAGLLSRLLARCPRLVLLVTSRERLRLEEEIVHSVGGLAHSPSRSAEVTDSMRLFEARAAAARPDFRLTEEGEHVSAICHLVEGSPLGIELAAGWVGSMSCGEIADEIRTSFDFLTSATKNVPEKHRSVRAAFESSWRLLSGGEQLALSKLAVFRGGFARGDAATVAGVAAPVLASLVDMSLVRFSPPARYAMHPLLHRFAEEKLTEDPAVASATRGSHAEHFVRSAEEAEAHSAGPDQVRWFRWSIVEMDNCRAALMYLEVIDDVHNALRLAASLGRCGSMQGDSGWCFDHLARLLSGASLGTRSEAKALLVAGELAALQGDGDAAEAYLKRGGALAADLRDEVLIVLNLREQGVIAHHHRGDPERARLLLTTSLERARRLRDPAALVTVLRSLGNLEVDLANNREARGFYEEAAAVSKRMGDEHGYAKILCGLATVLSAMGDTEGAHAANERSLASFRAVGDLYGVGIALLNKGMDASRSGDSERAVASYRESLGLFEKLGNPQMVSHLLNNLGSVLHQRGAPQEARELLEESLLIQQTVGNVFLKAQALHGLGNAFATLNRPDDAYRCYQDCLVLCRASTDNWSLMRVLGSLAKWHLARGEQEPGRIAVTEAIDLAQASQEHQILAEARQTEAALADLSA